MSSPDISAHPTRRVGGARARAPLSHLRDGELLHGRCFVWLCSFVLLWTLGVSGCGPAPLPLNEPGDVMSGLTDWSATYKWVINDWSKKRGRSVLKSETFCVGGHNW